MNSTLQRTLIAMVLAAFSVTAGCKSDSTYREQEKTAGAEEEAKMEHGVTGEDESDQAEE